MTLQEHLERMRRSIADLRLGGTGFADLGRTGRSYADRALAGLGTIDLGGLFADLAAAIAFYTRLPLRPAGPVDGAAGALVVCLVLRIGAIADLPRAALVAWALVGAHATARAALPIVMRLVPPARADGLSATAGAPSRERTAVAAVIGIALLWIALGFR